MKLQGDFVWHHHADEDEMFLVVHGTLQMDYREADGRALPGRSAKANSSLSRGEWSTGPVHAQEVHVLLFEPASTLNTGNVRNELTVDEPTRLVVSRPDCNK